ncbi:MAG: 30S ribosomal protein S4 [Nanoarchaeota archaeon]|nr:30S ribosomal protein S4 [Nanoarchaeota archaeon]
MGIVKKPKKKYSEPSHPWQGERIQEEKVILKEYGLKNKTEIWKINSKLKKIKTQAKKLIAATSEQSKKEEKLLLERLVNLGILNEGATLNNILEINLKEILNRRLQSVVLLKGLARTSKQARQMISHGHITLNNKKLNVPSYLVRLKDESELSYSQNSSFNNHEHPERVVQKKKDRKRIDVKEALPKEPKQIEKTSEETIQPQKTEVKQ